MGLPLTTQISARARRLRGAAVVLLVIAGTVNYFDRAAVSVGNPDIRQELGLTYGQMGLLLSAFAWAYGLAQIPAGALVDRFGPRRTLAAGMVLWSIAQIAAAGAGSLVQFVAARIALGIGESPMYLGGTRVCADWYAARERAWPIALFNSSSALAPALAPPLLTILMLAFGWRVMFVIAGLAGFAVAVLWLALYRTPERAGLPPGDLPAIRREDDRPAERAGLAQAVWLMRHGTTWGMFIGFFGVVYVSWLYATWLPGYLEAERHLDVAQAGFSTAIPLAAGFVGSLAGGAIAQLLGRRGMDPTRACRIPTIAGLIVAGIFTVAGAYASDTGWALALMAVGLFAANLASSCGWALAAVIAPPNTVATLEAIQNVGGSIGGALAPLISGFIYQITGSFLPAFVAAGLIALVSAAAYWILAHRRIMAD